MYETLLLIAQAVKSGLPFSAAIRLTVGDRPRQDQAAFLKLAEFLDKGIEPKAAAAQSGLPKPVVELIDVAVGSGDFAGTFDELAKLEIGRSLTIHRVLQALAYPTLLLISCVVVLLVTLTTTVPQFERIHGDFDTEVPVMTQWVFLLSHWVRSPLALVEISVFGAVLFFTVRCCFPRFWFCIPVFGYIGRCLYSARMLRQMANQVSRNIPLPNALEQCAPTMRNIAYRNDCRSAANAARNGMSFVEIALRYYWLFPAWLAPMLAADASPEKLSKSLRRAAETVEQQKDTSILLLQTLSLPLFIMFVFSFLGFFVLALFLPLIKLITSLSG